MKVSIIIPYHNGEAYLRDCLDSLIEQTYQNMEILLICDRVKDEDIAFIGEYKSDLTIRVYHLEDKTGVAAARNLGLDKADGDYVYFLDSDDYLLNNTIEILVEAAQERDDDIIYGRKKWTWFQRNIYLTHLQEEENEDVEEEDEEGGRTSLAESSIEKGSEKDNINEETTEDDETFDSGEDDENAQKKSSQSQEDGDLEENELTEEKIQNLIIARRNQAYRILVAKRKGVRNISVLNILFKRNFIEEHNLRFSEDLIYFSDVPFLLEAMSKTDNYKKRLLAKYIKRRHNDPVNFPSLSQIKDPNRYFEFIDAYYDTINKIPSDSELRNRFDKKYIDYYVKVYAPRLKRSSNDIWRNDNFYQMSDLIKGMNHKVIKGLHGYRKRIVKALIKGDVNKSIRIVKFHLGVKKFKKIIKSRKAFAKFLYIHSFLKKPMQENWVLLESFFGKSYSDSPKYIYEYLSKNYPDQYKFIWVIDKKNTNIPYKHTKIKRFSIRYAYYLARCKFYVFNGRQPDWVRKREGNIFLQTWHGTPLKKLVFDLDDISSATPKYKQQAYKQSRSWDYLISPNKFCSETFPRCFMFEKELLETGYPRNDILHAPNRDEIAKNIKKKLGIPDNKKTILYAPTWRDDEYYAKGQYKFELQLNLNYMKQLLGDEYVLLIRTHYFIADSLDISSVAGFAYNLSKYDDISELYLISDILITDYSSVFFDYANLKRPMLFFTYDLEKYRDVLRGFYIDIEKEVPGPLLFNTEEVVDALKNIDTLKQRYSERYDVFYERFCGWEDGHAAEKVVKKVFEK